MINEKQIHTTPIGTGNYPYLFKADTQFEKPDGVYTVKFVLSKKEAEPFIKIYVKIIGNLYLKFNRRACLKKTNVHVFRLFFPHTELIVQ